MRTELPRMLCGYSSWKLFDFVCFRFRSSDCCTDEYIYKEYGTHQRIRYGSKVFLKNASFKFKTTTILGILNGLLLSSILARSAPVVFRSNKIALFIYKNAGADLAPGYIFLQREKLLCSHNNGA